MKNYAMKMYGGVDVYIHVFFTSALVGGEWLTSRPCRFTTRERAPDTHWIGGWVGPRASLDDVEKRKCLPLPRLKFRPLGRPAHSQSLYRLRYPGSKEKLIHFCALHLTEIGALSTTVCYKNLTRNQYDSTLKEKKCKNKRNGKMK
jgi:hypothetical protein